MCQEIQATGQAAPRYVMEIPGAMTSERAVKAVEKDPLAGNIVNVNSCYQNPKVALSFYQNHKFPRGLCSVKYFANNQCYAFYGK